MEAVGSSRDGLRRVQDAITAHINVSPIEKLDSAHVLAEMVISLLNSQAF